MTSRDPTVRSAARGHSESEDYLRAMDEIRVRADLFELLFVHGLDCPQPFRETLRVAGVDLEQPLAATYPVEVWHRALMEAARHFFPDRSQDEADLEMGRRYIRGYERTLLGSVVMAGFCDSTPALFLERYPRFATHGRPDAEASVEALDARSRRISYRTARFTHPYVLGGLLLECMERLGAPSTLEVTPRGGEAFWLTVRW